ncbi:dihydrolipoamide dehydrogenase [Gammaproteobacteria bacterium]
MSKIVEVRLPDIGNFKDVDVIEVLVSPGDSVQKETSLVTLESDKATMEVPSPHAGVVKEVRVKTGSKISKGELILTLVLEEVLAGPIAQPKASSPPVKPSLLEPQFTVSSTASPPHPARASTAATNTDLQAQVLVLGAGPGGYTAAFRAADLGLQVILVERYPTLGGVCLNVGCIPSKALLHVAKVINDAAALAAHGVTFNRPTLDLPKLRTWKESVVSKLTKGLAGLAKQRKVQVVQGNGRFIAPHRLEVDGPSGRRSITFQHAIIAAGSASVRLPGIPYDDLRVIDATGALALPDIPAELLVIGGGIIGLEMANVYAALGSRVTVVELTPGLIPGCDADLVRPLQQRIEPYTTIHLNTKVTRVDANPAGLTAHLAGPKGTFSARFDRILVAVGRRPNGMSLGADAAGVQVDERSFIPVDRQQRTNVPHIYAIGDVVGNPMLAHKASHEGRVAAEVIANHKTAFDARVIPSVAYTDPEVAWVGLSETEAKQKGIAYEKGSFPWVASGRSLSLGRKEGLTKLLFDPTTKRLLGAGIVGPGAGELISEAALAIEMGADASDIALTIHPHPSLSETVAFSAEAFEGTLTDLYLPKKYQRP